MKILVDHDLCEGNARCMQAAPTVFTVDDSDRVQLLIEAPDESLRQKVEAAVSLCPRQALKLEG